LPEAPEVRIMSEFINTELGHRDVIRVEKNPMSKNKCDLSVLDRKIWKILASSRGKEMMLKFFNDEESHYMKVGFARIGTIGTYDLNNVDETSFNQRAMLRFYTKDKVYFISDFTRYVIWRWSDQWDTRRSPDIVTEHNDWRAHLYRNRKIPYFRKPIFEILCDQRFFNGVGTFSRSEILARTRFSPFTKFSEVLKTEILREDFFYACKETLSDITRLGGLQFEHWKNPFGVSKKSFNKWVRCYNNIRKGYFLKDSSGRKLWFQKKWAKEYVDWVKENEVQDTRLLEKIYRKTKRN
jgi:endonuclease VIII-like 1